jgi:heptaprenyl diphosphate synthase
LGFTPGPACNVGRVASANPLVVMPTMAPDLERVRAELISSATAEDPYLTEIATHLISAGGKLIRPGFCIAAAATRFDDHRSALDDVVRGAASVELVHLGSLYHDDVMDDASTRHFVSSVNAQWGNHRAILAGDFLLARASEIAASLGVEVAALLASTIAALCEGQVLELRHTFDTDRTESDYLRSITGKTASLLAASCRIGSIVSESSAERTEALTTFGTSYGLAFQLVDDVLDLVSTDAQLGKPAGHDISEGVYTLPVIRALADSRSSRLADLLGRSVSDEERTEAVDIVRRGPWIDETIAVARDYASQARQAISSLPPSSGTVGLNAAADHLVASVERAAA